MRGWVCRLKSLLALARSESRGTHDHILLSQIQDSPNLEGKFPVFISPRNGVAQLYSQALGSLFVVSYDKHRPGTDSTENVSSITACYFVAGETACPQSCSVATAVVLSPVYADVTSVMDLHVIRTVCNI
jgi:hypothetical protein